MFLRNKRGSIIIFLLTVSVAFFTVVSYSVYRLIHFSRDYQIVKDSVTKYQLLTSSLKTLVNNPVYCLSVFKDQSYLPNLNKVPVNINDSFFDVSKFVPEMTVQYVLVPQDNTNPDKDENDPIRDIKMADSGLTLYTYEAHLELLAVIDKGESEVDLNYQRLHINIPLFINIDVNGRIKSCYGINTRAYVCETRGGAWNPDELDLEKQCNPDKTCISYNVDTCPVYAKKIVIGIDNLAGHANIRSMGQGLMDQIRQVIINAFNSRIGAARSDTRNQVEAEVNQINSENWQRRMAYLRCVSTYNTDLVSYNVCMNTPSLPPHSSPLSCGSRPVNNCVPFTYVPLSASAVANEAIGNTSGIGADIADGILEEMDPKPEPEEVGEIIYDGFVQGLTAEAIAETLENKMNFHADDLKSVYRNVMFGHINNNINSGGSAGSYSSRIYGVATSTVDTHVDIDAVKADIDQDSEQTILNYVTAMESQREKYMCEWCNTYRYPP